jgi:hypothetical protein
LRLLSLRDQQIVECLVRGIQRVTERQVDGAAAFGAAVTGGETQFGEITRARAIERRLAALDFEGLRAQSEIGLEPFPDVAVDHRGEWPRGFVGRLRDRPQARRQEQDARQRELSQMFSGWTHV